MNNGDTARLLDILILLKIRVTLRFKSFFINHCVHRTKMVLLNELKRFDNFIISESGYIINRFLAKCESEGGQTILDASICHG